MRIISWNLHGASVPGKASNEKQHRSWEHMRELGADLIFAQEVSTGGVPPWVRDEWTLLSGEYACFEKTWNWGSVIAARPGLRLRFHLESFAAPWLAHLYDLVLVGRIDHPGLGSILVSTVHACALPVRDWLRDRPMMPALSDEGIDALRRPDCNELPYINDFVFTALDRLVGDKRFFVAGDWNTCRGFAGGPQFFERAQAQGWAECHQFPEEPSYFGHHSRRQLDHAFCDAATARLVRSCRIMDPDLVRELSDHAPLVTDLDLAE